MNDDKTITQHDIDEVSVRLRPILGIPPRRYLPALYGAAILAAAFLLLMLPGLRRPGAVWTFTADPPGSAVYVDGVYLGYAPCTAFVSAGERVVTVERPGFDPVRQTIQSRGRLFGTLVVKPRAALSVTLKPSPKSAALSDGVRSYSSWALAGSPSEAYQLPMVLSDAARAASIDAGRLDPRGLAGAAASYAAHAASLRDGARAVSIAYSGSAAVTPASLARLVSGLGREIRDDPAMLAALAALAPSAVRSSLESSDAYRSMVTSAEAAASAAVSAAGKSAVVAGEEFVPMGGGQAVIRAGSAMPAVVRVAPFRMAASETTVGRFRRFVEARPEWAPGAAAALASKGLAEADYLEGFDLAGAGEPVRNVSRPAALAYCAWLSESAPAGYRFDLPSEAQWAYAAAASGSSAARNAILADFGAAAPLGADALPYDAAGLKGMLGNVWEWCSDPYSANPATGLAGRERFPSAEGVVRGGSWANRSDLVSLSSRGAVPEAECSAYLGFRVVLVPEAAR